MAKITVEFDTVEKSLAVAVDGKAVANVAEVYLSKGYSDDASYGCSLTTVTRDDDQGLTQMTRLVASESEEGKTLRATASESEQFTDFLKVEPKSRAQSDIESFFGASE